MPHTIPKKHFYMIRHGQTDANAAQIMAGSIDSPLTQKGIQQAQSIYPIVQALEISPRVIIHSHLSRARDTARIINKVLDLPLHEDPDYAEMHAGDWEGVPYDHCRHLFRSWVDAPNGETAQDFFDRVKRAKTRALANHSSPLIVCHGGVFRAFGALFGIESQGVPNCELYEFIPRDHDDVFPWQTFRYEAQECGTVARHCVALSSEKPTSASAA